ncbi:hypothetical protein SKTS_32890 [Sulfurimicrobium lacus]|uniref:NTP pyrophosphohydrolase MazG putative catalytic core domain-containing protein n=1 Tax=Sulfurimicrobium lacus TaxID=2715678 RepID=A0A6F8VF07_9PROT|nr:hypothetical protein [Sulfurimicrobium lacus]BCB28403.1 hypothetical protein SKTS_32890 [Sulfurimicrobium lacus]
MNREQYLLVCLAEECAEVAQRVSKALRFGLDEIQPGQKLTNSQRITQELNDLAAVAEMLIADKSIDGLQRGAVDAKKAKVKAFMAYSVQCGTLTPESK